MDLLICLKQNDGLVPMMDIPESVKGTFLCLEVIQSSNYSALNLSQLNACFFQLPTATGRLLGMRQVILPNDCLCGDKDRLGSVAQAKGVQYDLFKSTDEPRCSWLL